ncbi:MAG: hypothetical protein D6E12_06005 [Desulfovibrio sp.]|nr:MAG: hypothetical protein D6E12_06005 [Desulfovibrio sp.]
MLTLLTSSFFRGVLESLTYGVVLLNIDRKAYAVNQRACDLLEVDAKEVIGKGGEELFAALAPCRRFFAAEESGVDTEETTTAGSSPEISLAGFLEQAAQLNGGAPSSLPPLDTKLTRKNRETRYVTLSASQLIEGGKLFGILVSLSDVSRIFHLHEHETALLKEKQALEQERSQALLNFSQAVAHQIRNPLMSMAGFARILHRKAEPGSSQAESLDCILEGGDRLQAIVNAVAEHTSWTPGKPTECDLAEVLAPEARSLLAETEHAAAPVTWELDLRPCPARIDADMVLGVCRRVLANSITALGQSGGHIILRCFPEDSQMVVEVKDTGPGMGPDVLPFVFDPFFTTDARAVGMGLTTAKRMAEESSGSLSVTSSPGQGTTVTLRFP